MYTSIGSILTYQCKTKTSSDYASSAAVEMQVAAVISSSSLDVIDFNVIEPSLANSIAGTLGGIVTYDFQMTLKIKTRVTDYEDENDVKGILDNAIYQTVGSLPSASVITNVQPPGGTTITTAPNQTAPAGGILGTTSTSAKNDSSSPSIFDSFSTFLKGAGVGGFLGIGLALVAFVLLISLATSKKLIPGA